MDDVYRAEFPGPYYSTSSVYSYSPTSASDCPEHGRSRRKITVILTTSIVLATLGVLSIAGVAAYLGILSKNISNNASQSAMEESYLLSESNGRINGGGYYTTTEENEYIFTTNDDVVDALDGVPGDSLVDLTNSLSETKRGSSGSVRRTTTTTTPVPPRTIEGHYGDANNRNSLMSNNDNMLLSNMVTAPPPIEEDTGIRFFTEEASSSLKPFTKVPPRHNRNRQRFPLTNSHSMGPSTTTLSTIEGEDDHDGNDNNDKSDGDNKHVQPDDLGKQDSVVIHLSHPENAKVAEERPESLLKGNFAGITNNSKVSNREGLPSSTHSSSTVVYVDSSTVSSASSSTSTALNRPNKDNLGRTNNTNKIEQKQSAQADGSLRPISKLNDKDRGNAQTTSNNGNKVVDAGMTSFNNEDDVTMQKDQPSFEENNLRRHDHMKNGESEADDSEYEGDSRQDDKPHTVRPHQPIRGSEKDDSDLKNHKLPLTFDKISPEYYDTQPWTPLLNRPNLDKRPRVDIDNGHLSSTEPIIVWNSEEPEEESIELPQRYPNNNILGSSISPLNMLYGHPGANFTVGTYYGYGHSGPSSESEKGNRPGVIMDAPMSYAQYPMMNPERGNTNNQSSPPEASINGFRPSNIPAYTILIPHIPNPSNASKTTGRPSQSQDKDELISPLLSPPENYGNSYKMDRLGEVDEEVTSGPHDDSVIKRYHNPTSNYRDTNRKDQKKNEEKITYNFEAIKTIPVPEDEELKDEDYMDADVDEFTESIQDEPMIYRLDPESVVDLVPDTLGNVNKHKNQYAPLPTTTSTVQTSTIVVNDKDEEIIEKYTVEDDNDSGHKRHQHLRNETHKLNKTKNFDKEFSPESMELVVGPKEPDVLIKSTTDLIMSTLGSLNLIKAPLKDATSEEIEDKLRSSDILPSEEAAGVPTNSSDSPLFPPVRSYVGVNQPLRPKPNPTMATNKQFRLSDGKLESMLPSLSPDVATTASLQKVISMMLGGDDFADKSRHLANHPLLKSLFNKQNVTLVVGNETGTPSVIKLDNVLPTAMPTQRQTPTTEEIESTSPLSSVTSHREQKSYSSGYRDSKIDHAQFTTEEEVEHVPVPLIVTESPVKSNMPSAPLHLTAFPWSSRPPKSSSKVHNHNNSPVYKFVLKKGQSVEDLLKEIFLNYTDIDPPRVGSFRDNSDELQQIPVKLGMIANNHAGFKSLEDMNFEKTTTAGSISPPVRISHHVEAPSILLNSPMPTDSTSMEEESREVQTSTSVVVNEEMDMDVGCGTNDTFKCVSNGKCIPAYLRCNFIKECEDNSDEEGCLCADFLRANGNARKLCDGIPDCADASDEYQDCEYCQPGQYICAGTRSCINKEQICDSKRDCQYGDDESDCVKIGHNEIETLKEDFSPTYHRQGHLMVRKTGNWGKLCVESFSSVVSHWEVKDLARAVCKALTFSDYDKVETVKDPTPNSTEPYYELHYGSTNQSLSSGEAHQRPGLGFRQTECQSKQVVNVTCQDLQCGVAPRAYTQRARIVGGANSLPGKWPWQAALYKNGEYQCGATLISSRWLLSAGHCFYHAQDDYWVARLGTLRRGATVLSPYEQVVRITHIFLHPEYKDVGFINDVSLLRLEKEVNFTDFVRPVCLPGKESRIRDGRMCTVVGWGQLFEVGRVFPDTLQEVQLPLISTGECRKRTLFLPLYKLTEQMFCAGFDRGGRDACLGDSGGPLMCPESDGRWSLYGVTSNGYGCARANRPGVYTKVTSYLDWIYDKMSQDSAFSYRDKSKPCPGHRCLLGECLDKRQVCNGIRDCIEDEGSDERGPNCTTNAYLR